MIITRTPTRCSLFGGGTDFPQWYEKHSGAVLGFALNKYHYISIRNLPPFFEHKHRIVWSKVETVKTLEEIEHPAVRAILKYFSEDQNQGFEIHHDGDLPAQSGLGSSSSFSVGLINALYALAGKRCSKKDLATNAIFAEQKLMGEAVGCQDQIWAAYGGFNRIDFHPSDGFTVTPMVMERERRERLMDSLVLVFTGLSRSADKVEREKIKQLEAKKSELQELQYLVEEGEKVLTGNGPLEELGSLLNENWKLKRSLAGGVTNARLDELYEAGIKAGAVGGKLLGAGAGGFMLFYIQPEHKWRLKLELKGLIQLPVGVDWDGSRVAMYEP